MPPRRAARPVTRNAQSTLSFTNKVTKPGGTRGKAEEKAKSLDAKAPKTEDVVVSKPETKLEQESQVEEEPVEQEQEEVTIAPAKAVTKSEEELQADKITDTQIKRYWREKEAERKSPRVHQQGLTVNEKILRHFDLSSQYGPCIGIARRARWERSQRLHLEPPIEVLAVLQREDAEGPENAVRMERAYVDELLGGTPIEGVVE